MTKTGPNTSTDSMLDKIHSDLDELSARVKVSDDAMANMSLLYGLIWPEACYDPMTKSTQIFAQKLLPYIKALNHEFRFKK